MDRSALVRVLGYRALMLHGDTGVLDRWMWLARRMPVTASAERVLDVGFGNGAFAIGLAHRGYDVTALSWVDSDRELASGRAAICGPPYPNFEVQDVRYLSERVDLREGFDVVVCTENIEHVRDDFGLVDAIAGALRPGGRLLLTTPNAKYRPIRGGDNGPFSGEETGGHVRRGYSKPMLEELCLHAGLVVDDITFCCGPLSQKATSVFWALGARSPALAWLVILPARALPPLLDPLLSRLLSWPSYSICLEAYKPR